jgi:hypothetical protein
VIGVSSEKWQLQCLIHFEVSVFGALPGREKNLIGERINK